MSGILVIVISLLFVLFFSGMESAFIRSDQLRIELDRKNGVPGSEVVRLFNQNPALYITTMLIGNFISVAAYVTGFYLSAGPLLAPLAGSESMFLIISIIISSLIILIAAEVLPRMIFEKAPNTFLKVLGIPALFFFLLFYPIAKLILAFSDFLLRIFSAKDQGSTNRLIIAADYVRHHENPEKLENDNPGNDNHNVRIFRNLLGLSDVRLREIMVPRTEIEAVPVTGTVEQLREKFILTRFARILVYHDTIDNIAGYCEVKDIFRNPSDIKSIIRKLIIVPETMSASRLLQVFVAEKKNIAVVVDEFGGTSGMLTIEDLLEEIVGDIEDEHDTSDLVEKVINQNEYILSGRLEIDYLNEKYDLDLPEGDDYATLAGMILFYNGSIPRNNDVIRIGNMVVRVLRASATRLELVNLKIGSQ